jgi:hypothetical protein
VPFARSILIWLFHAFANLNDWDPSSRSGFTHLVLRLGVLRASAKLDERMSVILSIVFIMIGFLISDSIEYRFPHQNESNLWMNE